MRMKKFFKIIFIFLFATNLYAAGTSGNNLKDTNIGNITDKLTFYKSAEKRILKAKKYEKKGKIKKANKFYKEALEYLYKANKENSLDPDTLNYLGFTTRKLGNFEDAEIYYNMGLKLNPNHVGINEYLGELYVQTNRLDKAKERLRILENCNCEEYKELKDIIEGKKESKY